MAQAVIVMFFSGCVGWLVVYIIQEAIEARAIRKVADAIPSSQLRDIFKLIEAIGTEPSKGHIGALNEQRKPSGRLTLTLPYGLRDFPWAGMAVQVVAHPRGSKEWPVEFAIQAAVATENCTDRAQIEWLEVPCVKVGKKGRTESVISVDRYLRHSSPLAEQIRTLYPKDPKALLAVVLKNGGRPYSSEQFQQLRCGLSAGWIQTPRFRKCRVCRRPTRLILQVPGYMLSAHVAEGCFYLHGCPSHPDETITDDDWG